MNIIKSKLIELSQREKFINKFKAFLIIYYIVMLILVWTNFRGIAYDTFFSLGLVALVNYDFLFVLGKSIRSEQENVIIKNVILSNTKIIFEILLVLFFIIYLLLTYIFKIPMDMMIATLIFIIGILWIISSAISKKFGNNEK